MQNPNQTPAKRGPWTVFEVDIAALSAESIRPILSLDVSGFAGKTGQDGQSHLNAASSGSNGSDGQDGAIGGFGEHGAAGTPAGEIGLSLKVTGVPGTRFGLPWDGMVAVRGYEKRGNPERKSVDVTLELPVNSALVLKADGGHGGNGGNGGRGQNGGRGGDGRDATRYSSGGDGGDGGDGGAGGNGGMGGNGGNGGVIYAEVLEEQSHLLMLMLPSVRAGVGGKGGSGGQGGSGGSYGKGGDSYTWREASGKDSNGNTRYVSRHSAGGSNGSSGRSGSNGSSGSNGVNGNVGEVYYSLNQAGNLAKIPAVEMYDLELVSYSLRDGFGDGIWEFGERVFVEGITVRNSGKRALPAGRHVYLFLRKVEGVLPEGSVLKLPVSLEPGASWTWEESLSFDLDDPKTDAIHKLPLITNAIADPEAIMGGVLRLFDRFALPENLTVQFPVRITPVIGHHSIGRGEATSLTWRVSNISQHPIGSTTEVRRKLETLFLTSASEGGDELSGSDLLFFDRMGIPVDISAGYQINLGLLLPGPENAIEIQGFVGIRPEAESMTTNQARVDLRLSHPKDHTSMRAVQQSPFQLRVAQKYRKTPGSDILLIINKDTHRKTVEDIVRYYQEMGSVVDVWDISHYGFLEFNLEGPSGTTLFQDFEGKTILLLNHIFLTNQQQEIRTSAFLSKKEFLRAANDFGIQVYCIGESADSFGKLGQRFSLPTENPASEVEFEGLTPFLKFLPTRTAENVGQDEGVVNAPLGENASEMDNFSNRGYCIHRKTRTWFWGIRKPREKRMRKLAEKLAVELDGQYPQEQFYVIWDYAPVQTRKIIGGFRAEWNWGNFRVRQGPNRIHGGGMVTLGTEPDGLISGSFFKRPETPFLMAIGLTIWESQEVLLSFLQNSANLLTDPDARAHLRDAFLYHIASEQQNLRRQSKTRLSIAQLQKDLVFLPMLTHASLRWNSVASPQTVFLREIFAHTLALVDSGHGMTAFLRPRFHNYRLTRIVRDLINQWVEANFITSGLVRNLDSALYEKNKSEKAAFYIALDEQKRAIIQEIKQESMTTGIPVFIRGFQRYIPESVSNRVTGNTPVIAHAEFLKHKERDAENEIALLQFRSSETDAIERLTYNMVQESGASGQVSFRIDLES